MYEGTFTAGPRHQERLRAVCDQVRVRCEALGLDHDATERCITVARNDFLANNVSGARAVAAGGIAAAAEKLKQARNRLDAQRELNQSRRRAFLFAFSIIVVIGLLVGVYTVTHPVQP